MNFCAFAPFLFFIPNVLSSTIFCFFFSSAFLLVDGFCGFCGFGGIAAALRISLKVAGD